MLFGLFKDKTIEDHINKLPTGGVTVKALQALDFVVPGTWDNPTNFDQLLRTVTREADAAFLDGVKKRAMTLWHDQHQGYQKALDIYTRVDTAAEAVGLATFADKIGESVKLLSFLEKLTPKAETSQTIDLAVKIISELLGFTKLNGIPGDGIGDFVKALEEYAGEARIRMAAIVAFDGIIPLGPEFLNKSADAVKSLTTDRLDQHGGFQKLKGYLPGGSSLDFVQRGFEATTGWMEGFVNAHQLSREGIAGKLRGFIDFSEDKLEYLAAFLDVSVHYFGHTGTQSVATRLIERAASEA